MPKRQPIAPLPVTDRPYGEGPGELSGVMPLGPSDLRFAELLAKFGGKPGLQAAAKPLSDWLGEILTAPKAGKAFPKRMRLTSIDPEAGSAVLHDLKKFTPFDTSIAELRKLLSSGELVPHGPATEGATVPALVKKLSTVARRKP